MKGIRNCYPLFVLFVAGIVASCHQHSGEEKGTVDSMKSGIVTDSIELESDYYWQNPYPELTWGQLCEMVISSIVNGDKETFASLVDYPIRRNYPLHNIENRQQMIDNFDLIFDTPFRNKLRTMDSNSCEEVGWRGNMLCDGMLWGCPVQVINYSSPMENRLRDKIIVAEMRALHPLLQGEWEPEDRLLLDNGKYGFARIDVREKGSSNYYRLTIFNMDAEVGDKPVLTLYGDCESHGTICNMVYDFSNDDGYKAVYEPENYPENDEDCNNFKNYILLTNPDGKTIRLIIEKDRYYQPNPFYDASGRFTSKALSTTTS